jgi:hypothetical protein
VRRYDDPVEVRRGPLEDGQGLGATEGPQQFLWRGRLWKVRAVLAHWVETGPWWQSPGVRSAIGSEDADPETEGATRGPVPIGDLLTERELWRVEAGRGLPRPVEPSPDDEPETTVTGVFDLVLDWADGRWVLVGCTD